MTRGSDPAYPAREFDTKTCRLLPEGLFSADAYLVPYSNTKSLPNLYIRVHIHPYPLQPGHIALWGAKLKMKLSTRGLNPRVEPAGRDSFSRGSKPPDPRHDQNLTGQSESHGSGRVGSGGFQNVTGQIG